MKYSTVNIGTAELTLYILSNSPDINPSRKRPLILICPGGGYSFCSDREAEPVAVKFCAYGFNTAVLRYTCNKNKDISSPVYPKPQQELCDSIAYIRDNAKDFNTNADMIAVMGFSAGGHLAASSGCLWESFNKNGRPDAIILCYPVISSGEFAHRGSFDCLCGNDKNLQDSLSLEKIVSDNTPPAFLWHTKTDMSVPVQNSLLFKEALDRHGIKNTIHLFDEGEHGMSLATKEVCNKKHNKCSEDIAIWPDLVAKWLFELFGDSWY